eukprot:CAMPEP_0183298990 /NCGR_PEP_ID=MMETSP0160_2-20130417/5839_1 /TAXON_ID=2839 ORGANISM="Odontella Sinensis, Strain Grunow 1884" /NCGR_SAMPLE_ID=MMETSP0160_2 /ASSEMBLY_ACC=CAM_ASM_000250 /LENGTH=112 /DNA_ID=CAMNT_0025461131 /DNA_START=234 /DNA_END=575 /DNA_ORIENTATION=+
MSSSAFAAAAVAAASALALPGRGGRVRDRVHRTERDEEGRGGDRDRDRGRGDFQLICQSQPKNAVLPRQCFLGKCLLASQPASLRNRTKVLLVEFSDKCGRTRDTLATGYEV